MLVQVVSEALFETFTFADVYVLDARPNKINIYFICFSTPNKDECGNGRRPHQGLRRLAARIAACYGHFRRFNRIDSTISK